jgi:Peptidase family M23/Putative peptidoglycan binding domain
MKISYPLAKGYSKGQGFDENANPLYAKAGMKGHGAEDWSAPYGTTIYAVAGCYLYSTINMGASPDRYRAVFTVVDDTDYSYEISYGHPINCIAPVEAYIARGTPIARVGNYGSVYSGGHFVTKEEKIAGSTAGSHLHFQIRKCLRVKKTTKGKKYLENRHGKLNLNGYYYEVLDPNNGYGGCVSPEPFYDGTYANESTTETPAPSRYYFANPFGKSNVYSKDADELQQILIAKGYMEQIPYSEQGYFGNKTAKALLEFQKDKIKLSWYEEHILQGSKVGAKTLKVLNG